MRADVIEAVAKKRGCLFEGGGGELDREKAIHRALADHRTGVLGRISLKPRRRAAYAGRGGGRASSGCRGPARRPYT